MPPWAALLAAVANFRRPPSSVSRSRPDCSAPKPSSDSASTLIPGPLGHLVESVAGFGKAAYAREHRDQEGGPQGGDLRAGLFDAVAQGFKPFCCAIEALGDLIVDAQLDKGAAGADALCRADYAALPVGIRRYTATLPGSPKMTGRTAAPSCRGTRR
jgi:hypothetical protein